MKNSIAFILLFALAPLAQADVHRWQDEKGAVHFSDRAPQANLHSSTGIATQRSISAEQLHGDWNATEGSVSIALKLTPGGGFVLDRDDADSPERLYMCGNWSADGGAVALDVRTAKEQMLDGQIEESDEPREASFEVLNATSDLLVVRIDGATLNFRRTTG